MNICFIIHKTEYKNWFRTYLILYFTEIRWPKIITTTASENLFWFRMGMLCSISWTYQVILFNNLPILFNDI